MTPIDKLLQNLLSQSVPPYKEEEKFYCKEYDKNGYTCEEQCKACSKTLNMDFYVADLYQVRTEEQMKGISIEDLHNSIPVKIGGQTIFLVPYHHPYKEEVDKNHEK